MRAIAVVVVLMMTPGGTSLAIPGHAEAPGQFTSLDDLFAPIALYPDPLLAQMLMSASDPAKVTELHQWLKTQTLTGTQLQDAAVRAGFDSSLVALVLFPDVIDKMASQIAWTTQLGGAFAADRTSCFAAIQRLRQKAQQAGTLMTTPQQKVSTKTTSTGEQIIVIEPANPQVVYVPQYNSQVVYTQAPATTTTVVVEKESSNDSSDAALAGLIGFGAGIAIGAAMDNSYYYGPYGWYGGAYMYNDAWDDYYDHREDARDDWQDHREDLYENRSDRAEDVREQRGDYQRDGQQSTERQQTRSENRSSATTQSATEQRTGRTGSTEARGYGDGSRGQAAKERAGSSDAFSGYSSGSSQRASSSRGRQSRSSSGRSGGGRRR